MSEIYLNDIKKLKLSYKVIVREDASVYSFEISEDLLINSSFLRVRRLTSEEYQKFLNNLPFDSVYLQALKFAFRKRRTIKEVKTYLESLTSSDEIIDEVVKKLVTSALLNDEDYFESYLDYAINVKRDGYNKIKDDLTKIGIYKDFYYPEESLKDNILILENKYIKSSRDMSKDLRINKAKAHLLRKGYREAEINRYFDYSIIGEGSSIRRKMSFKEIKETIEKEA